MNYEKTAPQLAARARRSQTRSDYMQIAQAVPQQHLAADYLVLAALWRRYAFVAPLLKHLRPQLWERPLHQIMARMLVTEVGDYGCVDHDRINVRLTVTGDFSREQVALLIEQLDHVGTLLDGADVVAHAVSVLHSLNRPGGTA